MDKYYGDKASVLSSSIHTSVDYCDKGKGIVKQK